MIELQALVGLATFVLWLYALLDVIRTDGADARHLGKTYWLLLVLFFPLMGSIAWLALGRPQQPRAAAHERARSSAGGTAPSGCAASARNAVGRRRGEPPPDRVRSNT